MARLSDDERYRAEADRDWDADRRESERARRGFEPFDFDSESRTGPPPPPSSPRNPHRGPIGVPDGFDAKGTKTPPGAPPPASKRVVRRATGAVTNLGKQTGSNTVSLVKGKKVSLAGFCLGLVGYAVGINLIQGGPTQVKAWFSAKFLNKVTTTSSSTTLPQAGAGGADVTQSGKNDVPLFGSSSVLAPSTSGIA